jgi:molybdate transport system substrate-binding protein
MARAGWVGVLMGLITTLSATLVLAAEVRIAVAANFTEPAKELASDFEAISGYKTRLSFGATGQLYAQIVQGAPFDVLLAADRTTPDRAIAEGHGVAGTQRTYAIGRLVLYSNSTDAVRGEETLREAKFDKLAIANPATAPYGAAAIEVLTALRVIEQIRPKLVQGSNIAQAYQFVATGSAEVGFVALSQVQTMQGGSRWLVPATLHTPIAQDAVLLRGAADNQAAKSFLAFLGSPAARGVIQRYGYGTAD